MFSKFESKQMFLLRVSLVIIFTLCMMTFPSSSHAGGGFISGDTAVDYLNAQAVGSNVVGYMFVEFGKKKSSISVFVKRCECLKRLEFTREGVLAIYSQILTEEEFDSLTPEVLEGMVDPDGEISTALGGKQGIVAVVEKVLEYKKVGNRFVARVSLKFVSETP